MTEALPQTKLAPAMQDHLDMMAAAKAGLIATTLRIQETCEHIVVSEMGYRSGGYAAKRIFNNCRLIEEGSHWSGGSSWSRHDHKQSDLGNADFRIVLQITDDQFYKMRLPI